ncbi:hypothetical protein [Microbacterium sp. TNHR37B]|uniref:hypothetical protein n=1 Tax=Microbacterium sp. TNHR37B TaxID=1775956 RepID=UPI0007B2D59A|nr:hypothetical protein [Microbacterium sp. TNHR37B]KZE91947.1 hypothetical protein AVP41_01497 [Microbacterium sp. TNHR37B]
MADGKLAEWITVKVATALVGRAPRTIYEWIENDRPASRMSSDGIPEVLSKAVVRVEPTVRRGRPRGTPTHR